MFCDGAGVILPFPRSGQRVSCMFSRAPDWSPLVGVSAPREGRVAVRAVKRVDCVRVRCRPAAWRFESARRGAARLSRTAATSCCRRVSSCRHSNQRPPPTDDTARRSHTHSKRRRTQLFARHIDPERAHSIASPSDARSFRSPDLEAATMSHQKKESGFFHSIKEKLFHGTRCTL